MPSSASLRKQIESAFEHRYPSVLTPAPKAIREVASTGITQIDELLDGGLPVGAITELTGPPSSGRTTIAMSTLSCRTREGRVCAWVDVNDSFDPESAAANGISLDHLLWIRCSQAQATKGANPQSKNSRQAQPLTRLDQALRATDLLLQSGGFAAIVLDLADESIEYGCRIPLATWFRYRQASDRTRCSLLVLGKAPYAQSSAAVVLDCEKAGIDSAHGNVIQSFSYRVFRQRERFTADRKPPASMWSAHTAWDAEKRA